MIKLQSLDDMLFFYIYLHNMFRIPENRVGVKISSGVEPEVELLLSVTFALCINISVNNIRITA